MIKKRRSTNLFSKSLVIFIFIFAVIQVFLANSLSVQGKEISRLNSLSSDLDHEIEILKQNSSSLSSLENVRHLAVEKLKMVGGVENFDYLSSSVALR